MLSARRSAQRAAGGRRGAAVASRSVATSSIENAVTQPMPVAPGSAKKGRFLLATAAGLLIVLVVAFFALRRDRPEPIADPIPPPPALAPQPQPTPAVAISQLGQVQVAVAPWAEIVAIIDAQGRAQPLPAEPFAPTVIDLEPGRYRLSLAHPEGEAPVACEVEVVSERVARCAPTVAETDAIAYFKATGWWR